MDGVRRVINPDGKELPRNPLLKFQRAVCNFEQRDCSLFVLPVSPNAPGELVLFRSEAEGGGHPQLSPEAGRLLHPFPNYRYGFAFRVFRCGECASRRLPSAITTLGTVSKPESLANARVPSFLRERARQRRLVVGVHNADSVFCRPRFCPGAANE